jgi:hypothetical protein
MIGDEFVKLNMSGWRVLTRRPAVNQNPISAQGASLKNLEVTACSSNKTGGRKCWQIRNKPIQDR